MPVGKILHWKTLSASASRRQTQCLVKNVCCSAVLDAMLMCPHQKTDNPSMRTVFSFEASVSERATAKKAHHRQPKSADFIKPVSVTTFILSSKFNIIRRMSVLVLFKSVYNEPFFSVLPHTRYPRY